MLDGKTLYILISFTWIGVKGIIFTDHSGYGCFAAIAVPLNIPHHNVFVSYNFAVTYGLPHDPKTIINPNGVFDTNENVARAETLESKDSNSVKESLNLNSSESVKNKSESNEIITKRAVYRMLRDKLTIFGFNGEDCLMKLVCEVNASMLGRNNGLLGSVLHILLSPSSSTYENLPIKMYQAEKRGINGDCILYEDKCPHNVLDLFSAPIQDFLMNYNNKIF